MRIKDYVRRLERKTYAKKDVVRSEGMLDCAGGKNSSVSQKVLEFARQYDWSKLWEMPDINYMDLKTAICKFWSDYADLKVGNIKIANGSSGVLERINKVFIQEGARVLGYAPQFTGYVADVIMGGGNYRGVPLSPDENFKFEADRLLRELTKDYCILYIDNPNNPTGQFIDLSDIEEIVKEAKKKDVVVIVDEAYGDYVEEKHSAVNLVNRYDNLVVTRTFSKGYGIAKFRIGYGILPAELSGYYNKIELPFPVSALGSHLAREALLDKDFVVGCRQWVKSEKAKLLRELKKRGYLIGETFESCPIFIIGCEDGDVDLERDLLSKGIISHSGTGFMNLGKNYVRINLAVRAEDFLTRL